MNEVSDQKSELTGKSFLSLEIQENVGVVWMDLKGEEHNLLSVDLLSEFEGVLQRIRENSQIKAVVLISRKKSFVAGADIKAFLRMRPGEAEEAARNGHRILKEIKTSPKPFVAAIHGACMGGGTEIALACAGRIATRSRETMMALPEVKLGLLPGMGAIIRLPKLIGLPQALDMLLTGKNTYAHKARKIGLVDDIVEEPKLLAAAKKMALSIAKEKFYRKSSVLKKLGENSIARNLILNKAKSTVLKKTFGNYPAPLLIIECLRYNTTHSVEEAVIHETHLFERLLHSPVAHALIQLFLHMHELKKNPFGHLASQVDTIGILGAGLMGQGIAEVSLFNDYKVRLKDIHSEALSKTKQAVWKAFYKKIKQKAISSSQAEKQMLRLAGSLDDTFLKHCDLVVEAIVEDLSVKQQVLHDLEAIVDKGCVIASNTSSIPISAIAANSQKPERIIGMHYFSPVAKMPLLEIVRSKETADWVVATAVDVGIRQGKTCIVVHDGPGFYTTRILAPYLNEALLLMEEGVEPAYLDKVMQQYGFPVGPITLIDEVGIDIGAQITEGGLKDLFLQRKGTVLSETLKRLSEAGFQGRKNRKGFWVYNRQGKKIKGKINEEVLPYLTINRAHPVSSQDIFQRLVCMMMNEAAYCLQGKIIDSPQDGDLGAVLGLGFPPFLGGPFRYMHQQGWDQSLNLFYDLQKRVGERFAPCPLLQEMAQAGHQFYP
ncbi:3-hydroxyacyl-CoA dehydrogenase NAD-binding domain-containing protein [Rapidithrix thailandica]|uniref:enoyl-CoA hydratase n=1 Tax=Rapidithrix thailandica TaxID=413964 RepID=A0AAW9S6P4_9BACT